MPLLDEFHLLLSLLLSAAVLFCAYRFALRDCDGSFSKAICDALLLFALIVYLSVVAPGASHCLSLATMSIAALAMAAGLFATCRGSASPIGIRWTLDRWIAVGAGLFATGYLVANIYDQRFLPPMSTDSLVYQLSTPVLWMRRHTLAIFPTWYWNPANSYAPQCSTTWFVWLLEPFKNDVLARFGQAPALLWIFVLVYRGFSVADSGAFDLRSRHGLESRGTGALIAVAAVLSRPLFSEALFAKDDLIVTALFLTAVMACSQMNLRDRFGPWRLGIALGLMLACKYTVLLVCPLFLFLVDAPFRAGWKRREFAIAIFVAALLAGPWYLRNLLLTGNPLFPAEIRLFGIHLFPGLFGTERDQQLRTAGGAWRMLSATYHSLPIVLLLTLPLAWVAACIAAGRSLLADPMRRAVLLGSMAVLLLFLAASPHHEVRYLFPLIVLWFDSAALAIVRWLSKPWMQIGAALLLAGISTATSFNVLLENRIAELAAIAVLIAGIGIGILLLIHRRPVLIRPAISLMLLMGAAGIYVYWHAYVTSCRDGCVGAWALRYSDEAPAWGFIRDSKEVPSDANVAFANTQFTYPLYGFNFQRDVAYAPTRRGLHSFLQFPRMGDDVPGDLIVQTMTRVMVEDPDRQTWLENLESMQARYLVVFRHEMVENPIELRYAAEEPGKFVVRYQDAQAVVFEIRD
jgi:hypothetical protein